MKVVSLFSGIGAYEKALKNIGIDFELINYCDFDKSKSKAYSIIHNVSEDLNLVDVRNINTKELKDFDLLVYSPPCFPKGHLVMTSTGYKKIEDVEVGDKVLTHTNNYKTVINTMVKESDNIYSVKAQGLGKPILCTAEHPFYVRKKYMERNINTKRYERKFKNPQWIAAKDLSKDYYVGVAINQESKLPIWNGVVINKHGHIKNELTNKFNDKRFWYLVGRWMGDGWFRIKEYDDVKKKNRYETIICCSHKEIEKLTNEISDLFKYCIVKERTTYKVTISNKELTLFLSQFGKGAKNKHLTNTIINLPLKFLKEFLRGYVDSDGYINITKNNKDYKISSISKELIYGIGQVLAKLGYVYSIIYRKVNPKGMIENRIINQHDIFTINWKENKVYQSEGFFEHNILWLPIRNVEKKDSELISVYNMEVEDDNSYTINNIIVHNCTSFSISGKKEGRKSEYGNLFFDAAKVIKDKKPKYAIMENVDNLVNNFRTDFDLMLKTLEDYGYNNYWKIINAKDFIPQNRKRVFIVSIRKDIDNGKFEFPIGKDNRDWTDIINPFETRNLTNKQQAVLNYALGLEGGREFKIEGIPQIEKAVITLRQSGLRFQNNREYPTITAHYGKGGGNFTIMAYKGHYGGIKPRQCFKLMGFDYEDCDILEKNKFSTSALYIMAGDSVVVPVLEEIFKNLFFCK